MSAQIEIAPATATHSRGTRQSVPRVALVNAPFTSCRSPSIQLGLLGAILSRHGITSKSFYFNLQLGAALGWDIYEALCDDRTLLLGEWLFARAAFGDDAPDGNAYLDQFEAELTGHLKAIQRDTQYLLDLRERVLPAFVEECLDRVDWTCFEVVGFSSIFEQNCAALALARRLKARIPQLITVFGGANFEDEMGLEYVRGLPWIDYAVIGEGDEVFPALLKSLGTSGNPTAAWPGVASRADDGSVRFSGRAPQVSDLDGLPEPDYTEFFSTAKDLDMPAMVRDKLISIPFETARGCWWGAKHHCTFCGLNGLGMAFRSKSPERALRGIDELAERYAVYQLVAVDNILDLRYIRGVFEPLAKRRQDYTFFYETKANLSQEQLKELAQGGVRHLQPGIESLSTHVLKLMRKGTAAIQNVCLLKWALYYGISTHWNVLVGFPGERIEDYVDQFATFRLISHLQPPESLGRIWLERFSPNYTDRTALGITNVRPEPAYAHVYPSYLDLNRIAYFFAYEATDVVSMSEHKEVMDHVETWQKTWKSSDPPFLVCQRGAGRLTVTDGRQPGGAQVFSFGEFDALVYEHCAARPRGVGQIVQSLREVPELEVSESAVRASLNEFKSVGLMMEENDQYLSLALPVNPNW
ncbi:MAG TPA: RiPP maturation radical SAM C-methyltransferase [Pyrinomonadaceae bacterium]|nr:RiPP maturation radical SAM C-methyltransferase [Pyrinomonadaceae bacterium]